VEETGVGDGGEEVDYSTVPPTPDAGRFLLSPLRTAATRYPLRSTPERMNNSAAAATLATLSRSSSSRASSATAARGLSAGRGRGSVAHARGVAAGLAAGGRGVAAGFQASAVAVGTARGRGAAAAVTVTSGPGTATAGRGRGGVIASASEAAPVGATLSQSTAAVGGGRSRSGGGGTVARGRGGTALGAAGGTARRGVVNYSSDEIDALMQCIRRVLPIGNDQWELVAELHGMNYTTNPWNAESIRRKFYSLANQAANGCPCEADSRGHERESWSH
jgi:hypothetical protein